MATSTLLSLREVAALLGRSPETVRKDVRRKPQAVPPRLCIPCARQLRWRAQDVERWLAAHVRGPADGGAQ